MEGVQCLYPIDETKNSRIHFGDKDVNNKFSSGWAWHIGICVILALFGLYIHKNGGDFYISGAISDITIANVIGTICSTSLLLVIVEIRLSQPKK